MIQKHSKETHHSRLNQDHATDDEQLRLLTSQVTYGQRRGGIVDKELSLKVLTVWRSIFELLEGSGSTRFANNIRGAIDSKNAHAFLIPHDILNHFSRLRTLGEGTMSSCNCS